MNTLVPALAVIQAPEERSTLGTMLDAIPTDPAALFVLAIVVGAAFLVVYFGLKGGPNEDAKKNPGDTR